MTPEDLASVTELLGREPQGDCEVVVRTADRRPVVIRNSPHLHDGTPMPTRYWLVGRSEHDAVSRLEAAGGVRRAERFVPAEDVVAAHDHYARERDEAVKREAADRSGAYRHDPTGGVGGTRTGVKCLHAHLAHLLAGGDDAVGRWVAAELDLDLSAYLRASTDGAKGPVAHGDGANGDTASTDGAKRHGHTDVRSIPGSAPRQRTA